MRIAHLITRSDAIGGAQVHVRDLSKALAAQGHAVTVLVGGQGPFTEELRSLQIPFRSLRHLVRPIHPYHDWLALWEITRTLQELQPDVLAAHSSKAGWMGRVVGRLLNIPTVFTAHGWAFTDGTPPIERIVYMMAEKLTAPLADRIITVSNFDRQLALRYRIAPAEKLVTIHNGVPEMGHVKLAETGGTPVRFAMVARFEPPKDHSTLLKALARLTDCEWELDLLGDGPLRPDVEAAARDLGLFHRVHFRGTRKDVEEILAGVQVLILTSNFEGFPLTVLEAMRAGLPVVASDVGGVREAVVDGVTGFLVPRGHEAALARRLEQLIREPVTRRRLGEAGRRRYEALFTSERMLAETVAAYHHAIGAEDSSSGHPC